jgi:Bacterial mobilisation protein (MobC)
MRSSTHLMTWVSRETKDRFVALARAQEISESALLKRIVVATLATAAPATLRIEPVQPTAPSGRLSVRLRNDDLQMLRDRAQARGIPAATYVSFLTRSHLRRLTPLIDPELKSLKHAIGEVSAIGRNLNQIARAMNAGVRSEGASRADLQALLRACTALRDAVKDIVNRNLANWETGYEEANH